MTLLDTVLSPLPWSVLNGGRAWASRNLRGSWWSKAIIPGRFAGRSAFRMNPPAKGDIWDGMDEK